MTEYLSGRDLIEAGMTQGKWLGEALAAARQAMMDGASRQDALALAITFQPPPAEPLEATGTTPFFENIEARTEEELANVTAVRETMRQLMRTPRITAGAVMPDACPAGPSGTIPVGGIAVSEAIHPGMHSADICCSMAISVYPGTAPAELLDAVQSTTHFGPGGRPGEKQIRPSSSLLERFEDNMFLNGIGSKALEHFGTQGDGNHFAFVGTVRSSGETALVTHHGSRAPGALLYRSGMKAAERLRRTASPETLPQNAWIEADTEEGDAYWDALQIIRAWTRENHFVIHDMTARLLSARVTDRFWNEHNFVFRRSDGLFYHAKGATPAWNGWAHDATDLTLIPLNMAEPILITRGKNAASGLGFAPHGAGRNFSRTRHRRNLAGRLDEEIFAEETRGIDARFYMGRADISELPSAYKDANVVRAQIDSFGLAEVVDEVIPHGCIMAGDWQHDAPWVVKARKKHEKRTGST